MSCRHGNHYDGCDICDEVDASFEAGRRSALAEQPAQQEPFGYFKAEPFGWTDCAETDEGAVALYTAPQAQPAPVQPAQRKPLTDDELADLWYKQSLDWMEFARAIEAKLKENT